MSSNSKELETGQPAETLPKLNELYPELYSAIFKDKQNVFITGPGGCGKSYCLHLIKAEAELLGLECNLTSTTGVSAFNIKGTTIHRFSGIGIGDKPAEVIVTRVKKNKQQLKTIRSCSILIIDEISMLGDKTFQLIDRVLTTIRLGTKQKEFTGKDLRTAPLFGGLQIVFSGDFMQLPPVNEDYVFESPLFKQLNFTLFKMIYPYRYPDENHFALLSRVRLQQHTKDDITNLMARVKAYEQYKNGQNIQTDIKPTRIYPLKKDVENINLMELDKLDDDMLAYECEDTITVKVHKETGLPLVDPDAVRNVDYIDFLEEIAPSEIYIKPSAQVILTKNLDVDCGLVNGARGIVVECAADYIRVKFLNNMVVNIAPIAYEYEDEVVRACRWQYPLILGWATSIHKQQGSTLDYAIIDLGTSIFAPGQAYVALSRCKTVQGLFIVNLIPEKLRANEQALKFETYINENAVLLRPPQTKIETVGNPTSAAAATVSDSGTS